MCARDGDGTSVELEGRDVWERRAYAYRIGCSWGGHGTDVGSQPQRASIYTFGGAQRSESETSCRRLSFSRNRKYEALYVSAVTSPIASHLPNS